MLFEMCFFYVLKSAIGQQLFVGQIANLSCNFLFLIDFFFHFLYYSDYE